MNALVLKIKRRETPFFELVYRTAKSIRSFSFPSIKWIHKPLYYLHVGVVKLFRTLYNGLWCVPLFRARCQQCAPGLMLPNGIPYIGGDHLKLYIGEDVTIMDSSLMAGHLIPNPTLVIGDRTTIGYHTDISVALRVQIGSDTMIAKDCYISDNDGHPTDPARRKAHEAIDANEAEGVVIGDNVWIGTGCCILKGSKIGEGAIIAANSVVTGAIWPNTLCGGTPARFIKDL